MDRLVSYNWEKHNDERLSESIRRLRADGWHILSMPFESYDILIAEGSATLAALQSALRDGADIRFLRSPQRRRSDSAAHIAIKSKRLFDEVEQCAVLDLIANKVGDNKQ